MKKKPFIVWVFGALAWAVSSLSHAAPPASYATCVACHGKDGGGNAALGSPALAGQQAAYLVRQLRQFRDGERGADPGDTYGAQMRAMSTGLSDTQIDEIAQYMAQQPPVATASSKTPDPSVIRTGSDYYQAKCGACHGGKAEGNEALQAPNLAILDAVYLRRQFEHFQDGVRGATQGDRLGRQMQLMSKTLSDPAHLDAVLLFITSQPAP